MYEHFLDVFCAETLFQTLCLLTHTFLKRECAKAELQHSNMLFLLKSIRNIQT